MFLDAPSAADWSTDAIRRYVLSKVGASGRWLMRVQMDASLCSMVSLAGCLTGLCCFFAVSRTAMLFFDL